jgi:fructose-1,6-bisphosphatase/inositol monophosphatase family enzyme
MRTRACSAGSQDLFIVVVATVLVSPSSNSCARTDVLSRRIDIDRLAAILSEAADSEIMSRFRCLEQRDVRTKTSVVDLVTEADEAAERFITAECAKLWPEALIVGEESTAANPVLLPSLAQADLAIVVDPIDGTANFAAGLPLFAVMAAVVSGGETVAGLIYDPLGRDILRAEKGAGAFLAHGGKYIRACVAQRVPLGEMIGTGSPDCFSKEQRREVLSRIAEVRVFANYCCAGHEYWMLATGHSHFAFHGELMPWDHLAGSLIVAEAGGYVRRINGTPYRPEHVEGGLIISTDAVSWQAVRDRILPSVLDLNPSGSTTQRILS